MGTSSAVYNIKGNIISYVWFNFFYFIVVWYQNVSSHQSLTLPLTLLFYQLNSGAKYVATAYKWSRLTSVPFWRCLTESTAQSAVLVEGTLLFETITRRHDVQALVVTQPIRLHFNWVPVQFEDMSGNITGLSEALCRRQKGRAHPHRMWHHDSTDPSLPVSVQACITASLLSPTQKRLLKMALFPVKTQIS